MGILNRFKRNNDIIAEFSISENCEQWKRECALTKLVLHSCISLISQAFASIHFRVYEDGKEVEDTVAYRLNIAPNGNESAATLWHIAG